MTRAALALAALAVVAVGCGTTTTHRVMLGRPGAPHGYVVRIAMEGEAPPPYFEEIALVQAVGRGAHADLEHVIDGLRREAAAVGADGVIRVQVDQGHSLASATGVAIRVLSAPPAPPAAPAYGPPPGAPAYGAPPAQQQTVSPYSQAPLPGMPTSPAPQPAPAPAPAPPPP